MKSFRLLLLLITVCFSPLLSSAMSAEMSILIVDDNTSARTDSLMKAIEASGYDATVYNATLNEAPSEVQLAPYDLVLWYTSTSGGSLKFWDGDEVGLETINMAIKGYLDAGGMLWVVGTDFLYDRYGSAPDVFAAGDFVYDYLGIASYDAQSKADDVVDGVGTGVTELNAIAENGICDVSLNKWNFSAMNYVDAMTPTATAKAIYEMGPADYVLAGGVASIYNEKGDAKTLVTAVDLALVGDFDGIMKPLFQQTLDYFSQYASADILPTSITVGSEGDASTITESLGELQLLATVMPEDATNKLVTWSIKEGSAFATISATGVLSGTGVPAGNGTVTVVATSQADESIMAEFEVTISGQNLDDFAVLLVNDNANGTTRYMDLNSSLANIDYDYRIYNMNTSEELPSVDYLVNFDVVIWYTGNDGADLYLWDVSDSSDIKFNAPLMEYLDLGGCVWVQGLDFFYDVYGSTYDEETEQIASFEAGDFVYDYMGIKTYVAQSHADDVNVDGTPQLDISEENTMTELDPIRWSYATMWYVDAVDVTPSAIPLYYLGDMTYDFSLYYAAVYNKKDKATIITYTFETARLDSEESTDAMLDEMLAYLKENLDPINTAVDLKQSIASNVYPVPATNMLNIQLGTSVDAVFELSVYDISGRKLKESQQIASSGLLKLDVSALSSGTYIYKVVDGSNESSGRFIVK